MNLHGLVFLMLPVRMETKDVTVSLETKTTPVLKPTMVMTQTISNEFIKIMELKESCKMLENLMKDSELKIQLLQNSKSEITKLKTEYLARNRINITNSESLLLAKNELYKYKCELKADYIATDKALKSKGLKYKNVIASYESDWQKTLEQYNSNQAVTQLCNLQQENSDLEKKIEELDRLYDCTKTQFVAFNECARKKFVEKIVEFSKDVMFYKTVIQRQIEEETKKQSEDKNKKPESVQLNFFKDGFLKLDADNTYVSSEGNGFSGVDVSVFDDMMIPIQNLETQNEEEFFPLAKTDSRTSVGGSIDKTHQESMDWKKENCQVSRPEKLDKEPGNQVENTFNPTVAKPSRVTENESQYFQPEASKLAANEGIQVSESWNQPEENHIKFENKEEEFEERMESMTNLKPNNEKYRNEQEFCRYLQGARTFGMDNEENVSDGSFENQYDGLVQNKSLEDKQRGFYEYHDDFESQYRIASPTSSEEMPRGMSADTSNESAGSPGQPPTETQNARGSSKGETKAQEESFKPFANFFTMNDDHNSPKPSIFKLF